MAPVLMMLVVLAAGSPQPNPSSGPEVAAVEVVADPSMAGSGPRASTVIEKGPVGEPLICRREIPAGTRLPVRTCRTAYDWAEKNAASLRNLDQMVGHGTYP